MNNHMGVLSRHAAGMVAIWVGVGHRLLGPPPIRLVACF